MSERQALGWRVATFLADELQDGQKRGIGIADLFEGYRKACDRADEVALMEAEFVEDVGKLCEGAEIDIVQSGANVTLAGMALAEGKKGEPSAWRDRLLAAAKERGELDELDDRSEALKLAEARLEGRTHEEVDVEAVGKERDRLLAGGETPARVRKRDRDRDKGR